VPVGLVESGTVDRVFRSRALPRTGSGRDDVLDGVGERLGREAPDVTLENAAGGEDFVDPPVVGRHEFEQAGRIECRGCLVLADQNAHRIGPAGIADGIEVCSEVDVVPRDALARHPAHHNVARHIGGLLSGTRRACRLRRDSQDDIDEADLRV